MVNDVFAHDDLVEEIRTLEGELLRLKVGIEAEGDIELTRKTTSSPRKMTRTS